MDESHGNRICKHKPNQHAPSSVRKIPADSVPLGALISIGGRFVWGAFDADDQLGAIGATAGDARVNYIRKKREEQHVRAEAAAIVRGG